ncbi:MAG: hypothetical protein BWY86_01278 [Candidatus Aminicenantes bacterium ADurb.Bin508]|nr:MAG: hypothetical protein BWY86_01278 [Candidatus Aminicenantes bacterium ADurb.Bin508]
MGLDVHGDVEVPRLSTANAGVPLAAQTESHPLGDPGRNLHFDRFGDLTSPLALAGRTGCSREVPLASALGTGRRKLQVGLLLKDLPGSIALGAGDPGGGGHSLPSAAGTELLPLDHHLGLHPPDRLLELEGDVVVEVLPSLGGIPPLPTGTGGGEEVLEDVGEGGVPDAPDFEPAVTPTGRPSGRGPGEVPYEAVTVVLFPLLGIRKHIVGLLNLLELLLRPGVPGVEIGVVLSGKFPIGLLDLRR